MKPIPRFPDYCITRDGRVWSKRRKIWLKSATNGLGYKVVSLYANLQKQTYDVHRLVLETYIGLRPVGMECRHLNGVRTDNRLINLCWGTPKENQQDSIRHGTSVRGERVGTSKLTEVKVKVIRYLYKVANFSLQDLAWQFDVGRTTIWRVINKETWKHLLNDGEV